MSLIIKIGIAILVCLVIIGAAVLYGVHKYFGKPPEDIQGHAIVNGETFSLTSTTHFLIAMYIGYSHETNVVVIKNIIRPTPDAIPIVNPAQKSTSKVYTILLPFKNGKTLTAIETYNNGHLHETFTYGTQTFSLTTHK